VFDYNNDLEFTQTQLSESRSGNNPELKKFQQGWPLSLSNHQAHECCKDRGLSRINIA
jgi:hypothetical protein